MTDPIRAPSPAPHPNDAGLRDALLGSRVIAIVGLSPDPARPSHQVARFLQTRGKRIVPVNPGHAGRQILGETVVGRVEDIAPEAGVDMIDLFRRSEHVGPIVTAALSALPGLKTVWMQIGVSDSVAAAEAAEAGCVVVMDLCPKIEWARLRLPDTATG